MLKHDWLNSSHVTRGIIQCCIVFVTTVVNVHSVCDVLTSGKARSHCRRVEHCNVLGHDVYLNAAGLAA